MKQVQNLLSFRKDTLILGDSLLKWGYRPVGTPKSHYDSSFAWLGEALKWIGAILALIVALLIAFWIIREIFHWLRNVWIGRETPTDHSRRQTGSQQYAGTDQFQREEEGNGGPNVYAEHIEHVHIYVNARGRNRDQRS